MLKEVASRLNACLRDSDTVARLGGDEFVVLLTELGEEQYAASVAQKIITIIAKPFILLGQEFRVTASIGISTYPADEPDEQTLTKNADIAMYQAKEDGKNNFQFYSEKLNANSLERLTLESSLRHAFERHEFELHYQVAEETGLIVPIGRWVLQTACLQNMEWALQGLPRLSIAINLTVWQQFSDERLLGIYKSRTDDRNPRAVGGVGLDFLV